MQVLNLCQSSKRAVLYFNNGVLSRSAFDTYSIGTILNYYKNNDIRFYLILFGNSPIDPKLQYLVDETGGTVIPFSSYEGVSRVCDLMREQKTGTYLLSTTIQVHKKPNGYFNLSVEINFNQQTGRENLHILLIRFWFCLFFGGFIYGA